MRITFRHRGNFSKLSRYFNKLIDSRTAGKLQKYGEMGLEALKSATPVNSGLTASSWSYEIEATDTGYSVVYSNSNVVNGWFNVALMLDVGHGTGTGGWVEGLNYIDPAIQPVFEKMAHDLWLEVTSL